MTLHLTEANALFLHTPKCGGTWIKEAIRSAGIEVAVPRLGRHVSVIHAPLDHFLSGRVAPYMRYDHIFTSQRDPLDWLVSYFKHVEARNWTIHEPTKWHPLHQFHKLRPTATEPGARFEEFIDNYLERTPGAVSRMYDWYAGPPGIGAVQVLRQENLHAELSALLANWYTVTLDHPRTNVGVGEYSYRADQPARIREVEDAQYCDAA